MRIPAYLIALAGPVLAACADGLPPLSNPPPFADAQISHDSEGHCYGRDVTPAVLETVTEHVMVQPAEVHTDGTVVAPAAYRTVTRQRIVRERREVLFESVCPTSMDAPFVASLQRALTVRGHFRGEIDGILDSRTTDAIRSYQRQQGLDSPLLDIRTARELGLVPLTSEELGI